MPPKPKKVACAENQEICDFFVQAYTRCNLQGNHKYKYRLQQAIDSICRYPLVSVEWIEFDVS